MIDHLPTVDRAKRPVIPPWPVGLVVGSMWVSVAKKTWLVGLVAGCLPTVDPAKRLVIPPWLVELVVGSMWASVAKKTWPVGLVAGRLPTVDPAKKTYLVTEIPVGDW